MKATRRMCSKSRNTGGGSVVIIDILYQKDYIT